MPVGSQSDSINLRERASWAWRHIGFQEWSRDLVGGVMAGVMSAAAAPGNVPAMVIGVLSGLIVTTLMLTAQFLGNLFERAAPAILRGRLKVVTDERNACKAELDKFTKERSVTYGLLVKVGDIGQSLVVAAVVSPSDWEEWKQLHTKFMAFFVTLLRALKPHERQQLAFTEFDSKRDYAQKFNEEHRQLRIILIERLRVMKSLLERYAE